MTIANLVTAPLDFSTPAGRASASFQAFAGEVRQQLQADEVVLLTTLPRGGLQICRRLAIHDGMIRRYVSELHRTDRLVWQAMANGQSTGDPSGMDTPIGFGFVTVLAVRIEGPVFRGYPGVVLVLRKRNEPAVQIDPVAQAQFVRDCFESRLRTTSTAGPQTRKQFLFDRRGNCLQPDSLAGIDPHLAARFSELAVALTSSDAEPTARVTASDVRGALVPIELVRFDAYPALSNGPVVFVSILPDASDWSGLSPDAFEADVEMTRLARAAAFMVANFRSGPTLEAIADAVQLSQFHFHRRFSDLFGVTPKHLLYQLQLDEAKRLLADPAQALVDIAKHCGFAHQSHFTSRFKQGSGVTPTRYRRQIIAMKPL